MIHDTLVQSCIVLEPEQSAAVRSPWLAAKVVLQLETETRQQCLASIYTAYHFLEATAQSDQRLSPHAGTDSVLDSVGQVLQLQELPKLGVGNYLRNQGLGRSLAYCRQRESAEAKQVLAAIDKAVATADRSVVDSLFVLLAETSHHSPLTLWFQPQGRDLPIPRPLTPPESALPIAQPISTNAELQSVAKLACEPVAD